jgi:hypothetical protein
MNDPIHRPIHYTSHISGVECIEIAEWMPFCLGNAIKYAWRAGLKDSAEDDLAKCLWYLQREATRYDSVRVDAEVQSLVSSVVAHERGATVLGAVLSALFLGPEPLIHRAHLLRAAEVVELAINHGA